MNELNVKQAILEMGSEDGYGLYEIIWDLRVRFPAATDKERLRAAKRVIKALLAEKLVYLYWFDQLTGSESDIPHEEAQGIVEDDRNWDAPAVADALNVWFTSTESGEHAYFSDRKLRQSTG
jgi:hypothetical protein